MAPPNDALWTTNPFLLIVFDLFIPILGDSLLTESVHGMHFSKFFMYRGASRPLLNIVLVPKDIGIGLKTNKIKRYFTFLIHSCIDHYDWYLV